MRSNSAVNASQANKAGLLTDGLVSLHILANYYQPLNGGVGIQKISRIQLYPIGANFRYVA
jgi:hypothetical protein